MESQALLDTNYGHCLTKTVTALNTIAAPQIKYPFLEALPSPRMSACTDRSPVPDPADRRTLRGALVGASQAPLE